MKNHHLRVVVITSNHLRHHYIVNNLAKIFNIVGVVSETKRLLQKGETKEENEIIKSYNKEWLEKENQYFGAEKEFNLPRDKILSINYGSASNQDVFEWVNLLNPDAIILFSSSIIKGELLKQYEGRMINLHLGLTPYYRGAAGIFWPLVMDEPECVGVTVHLVTEKLDSGAILGQAKPQDISFADNHRDISNKNIILGVRLLIKCINGYFDGSIVPKPQPISENGGYVFKHKDFNAKAIIKLRKNFESGFIKKYLLNKKRRDEKIKIVGLN